MGYRSEVAYVIRFSSIDSMKKFVAINALIDERREALEECKVYLGGNGETRHPPELHFHVHDYKWYDSYPEVQAHMDLLDHVDEEFCEGREDAAIAGYLFLRIGEDIDDIERKDGGDDSLIPWDALHVERYIAADFGTAESSGKGTIGIISDT